MNFKKLTLALAMSLGLTGIGAATTATTASAKTPTFPTHMRGTWYGYTYGSFDTIKITAHTIREGKYFIPASKLELQVFKPAHYHTMYTPRMKHSSGAYPFYTQGKVTWHGHHYYALFEDSQFVYTHHKIKHEFKVPKGY